MKTYKLIGFSKFEGKKGGAWCKAWFTTSFNTMEQATKPSGVKAIEVFIDAALTDGVEESNLGKEFIIYKDDDNKFALVKLAK